MEETVILTNNNTVVAGNSSISNVVKVEGNLILQQDGTVWLYQTTEQGNASVVKINGLPAVTDIFSSFGSHAAVDRDGKIWCFGNNIEDKFNVGNSGYISTPCLIGLEGNEPDTPADPVMLDDEQYSNSSRPSYHADKNRLGAMGWQENGDTDNAEFSAESGQLVLKKNSPRIEGDTALGYYLTKTFEKCQNNWNNDPRVSVRTKHFKGDYEIRIKGAFKQSYSQAYYDIMGVDEIGQDIVLARYQIDPGVNGQFSVYNNEINKPGVTVYPLWTNPQENRMIRTKLNFTNHIFQTYLNWSDVPSKTTVEGAEPDDTFYMTDWNPREYTQSYITGIRFGVQNQEPAESTILELDTVQLLTTYEKPEQDVDMAMEWVSMKTLTDTPENLTTDLKQLPRTLSNCDVLWSSSHPNIISDEGKLLSRPFSETDVTMTAKIISPYDKYTKYMDFKITVKPLVSFEETYLNEFVGEESSYASQGTTSIETLPMWSFSYPGITNGRNGEIHKAQLLIKDGYLKFKKISDRQTDSDQDCLVGIRALSNAVQDPKLSSADIYFTGHASGTGGMRFAPLTTNGTMVCEIVLNASDNELEINYGDKDVDGVIMQDKQILSDIDVTADQNYMITLNSNNTFIIYVNGKSVPKNEGGNVRYFLPGVESHAEYSKLKVWITNITYANTEVGNLKYFAMGNIVTAPEVPEAIKNGKAFPTAIGDDTYYANFKDGGKLYKDTSKLTETPALWLCTDGTDLFYNSQGSIYKYAGTAMLLNAVNAYYIVSDGAYLYFSNWSQGGKLYRLNQNQTNAVPELMCRDIGKGLSVNGDYLYYYNILDGGKMYRILKTATNTQSGELVQ